MLRYEDFAPHVGTDFTLAAAEAPPLVLTLVGAMPLMNHGGHMEREPFSLEFRSAGDAVLPQDRYPLRHAAMGDVDIFLVPLARDPDSVRYAATFN